MNLSIWNILVIIFFLVIVWYFFSSSTTQTFFTNFQDQITGANSIFAWMPVEYVWIIWTAVFIIILIVIFSFLKW